jgi:hypothetical protein
MYIKIYTRGNSPMANPTRKKMQKKFKLPTILFAAALFISVSPAFAHAAPINFTTNHFGGSGAQYVHGDSDLSNTTCTASYVAGVSICADPAHSPHPTYAINVYDVTHPASAPVLTGYYPSYSGLLTDGEYYFVITNNSYFWGDCSALSVASCVSTAISGGAYYTTVEGCVSGGVLSEGLCVQPTPGHGFVGNGYTLMGTSSANSAAVVLGGFMSTGLGSIILLSILALSVPLAFYILQRIITWYYDPRKKVIATKKQK